MAVYAYQPTGSEAEEYHKWYYNTFVWKKTSWMGITCWKSVSDMWNYQEILYELKPSLVIEFGTNQGGSALFFATIMKQLGKPFKVLSVDITHKPLDPSARRDPNILFVESSSTVPAIAEQIRSLRSEFPGKVFAILDSDHTMDHVLAEMKLCGPCSPPATTFWWRTPASMDTPSFPAGARARMKPSRRTSANSPVITRMTWNGKRNSAGHKRPTDS